MMELKNLHRTICTAAVACGLLFAGLGAGQATAAPVTGHDTLSNHCRGLQNDAKRLVDEYAGASNARKLEILDELRSIGGDWDTLCKGTFGDINVTITKPKPQFGKKAVSMKPVIRVLAPVH